MPERIVLHIGTHKTGTTSLQHFLHDRRDDLNASDAEYPPGFVLPTSHSELPLLAARHDRMWPARLRIPEVLDPAWLAAANRYVRAQVAESSRSTLVFSHEDLSYLRHDDEFERLVDLFAGCPVRVVVYLRDKTAYLRSYGAQLDATGFARSDDRSSFAYVEPDSWLVDYDSLLDGYRRRFGAANVEALDYDDVLGRDGSVIPSFARVVGLPSSVLRDIDPYFLNQSGAQLRPSDEQLAALRRRIEQQAGR